MFVDVLGTKYAIEKRSYEADPYFKEAGCDGYCDFNTKIIVVCKMDTYPGNNYTRAGYFETGEQEILRHEITHAFLYESGLDGNAMPHYGAWALNEEMIDWFAIQGPKIYDAWVKAKAI